MERISSAFVARPAREQETPDSNPSKAMHYLVTAFDKPLFSPLSGAYMATSIVFNWVLSVDCVLNKRVY